MLRQILALTCIALSFPEVSAQQHVEDPTHDLKSSKSPAEIAAVVVRSTVAVRASLPGGDVSAGSGFIADASGTIVTNLHVVENAERVEIRLASGDVYQVIGVRAIDQRRDIAILQIPGFGLPAVSLGNSESVQVGDRVVVIGNSLGVLENTVTTGVISGLRDFGGHRLFQMDAAISKGNSGGPVVNERGEVVGITVAKVEAGESLNFAIPVNYARGLLPLEAKAGTAGLRSTEGPDSLFAKGNSGLPRRWKSLSSGSTMIVRAEGDFIYVETVMPEQVTTAGGMWLAELKKQDEKWVGKARVRIPCSTGDGVFTTIRRKACSFEHLLEISVLAQGRIEGTFVGPPIDATLKCRSCTFTSPDEPQGFVWIPE